MGSVSSTVCDINKLISNSFLQLEEDLQNYRYVVTMGGRAKLKPGVLPHIFECQGRGLEEKRITLQRKRKILEILNNKENVDSGTFFTV